MALHLTDIDFNNGMKMPIVGLGTWQASESEIDAAVEAALEAGYRHIDTAFAYRNEAAIGRVLKRWLDAGKLQRKDLFIVTKLPMNALHADRVEKYLKLSLEALQLSHVDLYLVHYPAGVQDVNGQTFPLGPDGKLLIDTSTDHVALWKAMEAQVDAGRTLSIGLSNFNSRQIERIVKSARIPPANLQVELHLYFQQRPLVDFCKRLGVTVCAYAPIGSPGMATYLAKLGANASAIPQLSPMNDPLVMALAQKYKKTAAHILLRHIMQRGIAVIPKSSNPQRVRDNFNVFDFQLSPAEMWQLNALDKGKDGRLFSAGTFKGMDAHPEYPLKEPF